MILLDAADVISANALQASGLLCGVLAAGSAMLVM